QYQPINPGCTYYSMSSCYDHPTQVILTGPTDPDNQGDVPSTTVFNYEATTAAGTTASGNPATTGSPSDLDGTLTSVQIFAGPGSVASGQLLRTITYTTEYKPPEVDPGFPWTTFHWPPQAWAKEWLRHADNVRVSKSTTV